MKILALIAFLLFSLPAFSQCTGCSGLGGVKNGGSGTTATASGLTVTSGRSLVYVGTWCKDNACGAATSAADITSFTCTGETPVLKATFNTPTTLNLGFFAYLTSSSVGGTENCTLTVSGTPWYLTFTVIQLPSSGYTFDKCGGAAGSSTAPAATTAGGSSTCTGGGTLTQSNEMIVTLGNAGGGTLTAAPSGLTIMNTNAANEKDAAGKAGTGGSTYTATWTLDTSQTWESFVVALIPPAAGKTMPPAIF